MVAIPYTGTISVSTYRVEFRILVFRIQILDILYYVIIERLPQQLILTPEQLKEQLQDGCGWHQTFVTQQYQSLAQSLQSTTCMTCEHQQFNVGKLFHAHWWNILFTESLDLFTSISATIFNTR